MAIDFGVAAFLTSGVVAVSSYMNAKAAKNKVDQDAFKAAKDFYSGTLDEYRTELKETKLLRKELEVELKEAIAARERSEDKLEILGIQVKTLESDMKHADNRIKVLELLLKENNVDIPPVEEGS